MASISALKKSSADISRLTREIEKLNEPAAGSFKEDERFWQPEVDKAGNGYAVIRFLPAPAVDGDDALPWVRVFNHGFKGPTGKWYIENSLTTIGQKDPVSDYNTLLWNSTTDDNSPARKQVREQKRKLTYISNILVVKDPAHPENEGKVKLYKYGKKIFDKITLAMNPQYEDETPLNPFDFWEGANFKIKIRQVEGYRNYDLSSFDGRTAVGSGEEAELEKIWNSEYSLKEFIDPKNFKSYADLKRKLEDVLELNVAVAPAAPRGMTTAAIATPTTPAPTVEAAKVDDIPFEVEEDDKEMAYFKSLAQ